jgi:hypothetical protein
MNAAQFFYMVEIDQQRGGQSPELELREQIMPPGQRPGARCPPEKRSRFRKGLWSHILE